MKFAEQANYASIVKEYTGLLFSTGLNNFFEISSREQLENILLDSKHRVILKDIFEFALGIKFDNNFVRQGDRKNIRTQAMEKYRYQCFFDYCDNNENHKLAHELNYFQTKKKQTYLEGHHMIQMENSKFFQNDVDVAENIIPVCPNCHRKLHNADTKTVSEMVKLYCDTRDKKELMRKGIFVDIDTMFRFYGIEENNDV
ncbi:hypothetical protein FACS189427_00750 [Planctomycetales bacterium]|nr:hypothetical protein FACS189427_00750 [Planctomycetales bacterium]